MKRLYVNGCSLTWGTEVVADKDEQVKNDPVLDKKRVERIWPTLVGTRLGFDQVINEAVAGSSNEAIMDRTIRWLDHQDTLDDLFVLISWTEPCRHDFWMNGGRNSVITNRKPFRCYDRPCREFWSLMSKHGNEPMPLWKKFFQEVVLMQTFLKNQNIPYAMVLALTGFSVWDQSRVPWRYTSDHAARMELLPKIKSIPAWNFIDKRHIYGIDDLYPCMMDSIYEKGIGPDKIAPRGHPYADGHKVWANEIADWMERSFG